MVKNDQMFLFTMTKSNIESLYENFDQKYFSMYQYKCIYTK